MGHIDVIARTGDIIVFKGVREEYRPEVIAVHPEIISYLRNKLGAIDAHIETSVFKGSIFGNGLIESDVPEVQGEEEITEYDLPGFVLDIYDIKHVLLVTGDSLKLLPLGQIDNEFLGLYRNWAFDSYEGERHVGKALQSIYMNKDEEGGFVASIIEGSTNHAVAFLFEVLRFLGIKAPSETSKIGMGFQMSSLLDLGAGFHTVNCEM